MSSQFIQLDRQFAAISKSQEEAEQEEIRSLWGHAESKSWAQINEEFRTVILAEAGAGKTEEMRAQARHGVTIGRKAFFIRIEDIDSSFEDAFEIGDSQSFGDWISSGDDAWFYLDSVDEARLKEPRAFRKAIQLFANRIATCSQRAHIILSSRPYAWQPRSDRIFMDEILYLPAPSKSESDDDRVTKQSGPEESALQVYRLKALDKDRARIFAEARQTTDFDQLWNEIERLNLGDLAERPFDLEAVISKWKADGRLDGRLKLLRHIIDQRLREINPDRERLQPLALDKARSGASLLAAAVVLTGEAGIRVPDNPNQSGIDAGQLLADWNTEELHALLERAIFNDVLFGVVRFRHRETRELLAADWFFHLIQNSNSRRSIEALIFREQYGVVTISPRLRPILPWLVLMDENIRKRALAIHPEIAVEGGDPAELPMAERKSLLSDIVACIASKRDYGNLGDSDSIARIAQPDLSSDVLTLIQRHGDNNDALFFLARVVWQGSMSNCVSALLGPASDSKRRKGVRIVLARAILTCGTHEQQFSLWNSLLNSPDEIPRELATELVKHTTADTAGVAVVLKAVVKSAEFKSFKASGLRTALHQFIDRLPVDQQKGTVQPLSEIVKALNKLLSKKPYIERAECHVSKRFAWLLGVATHAVEKLVVNRMKDSRGHAAIAIMLKLPLSKIWKGSDFDDYEGDLNKLVSEWEELNDILFWKDVDTVRKAKLKKNGEPLNDDWPVQWCEHYWDFGVRNFLKVIKFIENRPLEDDKLIAVSLAHRIYKRNGEQADLIKQLAMAVKENPTLRERLNQLQNPLISKEARKWEEQRRKDQVQEESWQQKNQQLRSEWIQRLKASPSTISKPPGIKVGTFTNDLFWLFKEILRKKPDTDRYDGSNWQSLEKDFGKNVARAYRAAAIAHWKHYNPKLRSEGAKSNSTPYSLIFGMVGIEIEFREIGGFPNHLTNKDAKRAIRYLTWELNGFPNWMESLYRAYPKAVMKSIISEVDWELLNTAEDQSLHYIIHDLAYYAPWLHSDLIDAIEERLRMQKVANSSILRLLVRILKSGNMAPERLSKLASEMISESKRLEDIALWFSIRVDIEPDVAIPAVEIWLKSLGKVDGSRAAQIFVTALMGGRHGDDTGANIGRFRQPSDIKKLYVLMHKYIAVKDDLDRVGGGSYSPTLRDNAQDARNRLFGLLSDIPGKETYIALKALTTEHPNDDHKPWMEQSAFKRAEQDGELELWTTEQVRQFTTSQTRAPESHRQLFDAGVDRITDLKDWLEFGSDSAAETWQRVENETEMRNLVTGWLNSHSASRFSCAQENELPNSQRPDIWIQCPSVASAVPIELKILDKSWTGPQLCERLRNQLAGDYLRDNAASCGLMLLIWQGRHPSRTWTVDGKRVGIAGLKEALNNYWNGVSDSFPRVSAVKISVVDLTRRAQRSNS